MKEEKIYQCIYDQIPKYKVIYFSRKTQLLILYVHTRNFGLLSILNNGWFYNNKQDKIIIRNK